MVHEHEDKTAEKLEIQEYLDEARGAIVHYEENLSEKSKEEFEPVKEHFNTFEAKAREREEGAQEAFEVFKEKLHAFGEKLEESEKEHLQEAHDRVKDIEDKFYQ